jgi:4-amino-4-deoxy-L-arabinose transferase-like glycosyltransferase
MRFRFDLPHVSRLPQQSPLPLLWFGLTVYLGLHVMIRLGSSASLEPDEAEQLILSQHLAWGYNPQPPLYTWLVWLVFQVTGVSLAALTALKFSLIGMTYAFVHASARLVLREERLALLVVLSLLGMPFWCWECVGRFSHSVLLMLFCAAAVYAQLRWLARGRTGDALLLGICWAGGLLAKYNFAILALGLQAALISLPSARGWWWNWRLGAAGALAVGLTLPHGIWLFTHRLAIQSYLAERMGIVSGSDYAASLLQGMIALPLALMLGFVPLLGLMALLPAGWRGDETLRQRPLYQLLARSLLVVLGLLLGLVCLKTRSFETRWLVPLLIAVPLWYACRLQGLAMAAWRWRAAVFLLLLLGVASLVGRSAALPWGGPETGQHGQRDRLYAALATRCRCLFEKQVNEQPGTVIVVPNFAVAGNVKLLFPRAKVWCEYDFHPVGASNGLVAGTWWLIWVAHDRDAPAAADMEFLRTLSGGRTVTLGEPVGFIEEQGGKYDKRVRRVGIARVLVAGDGP